MSPLMQRPPPYLEPGRGRRGRLGRRRTFASRRRRRGPGLPQLPTASLAMLVAAAVGIGAGLLIVRATAGDDGRSVVERYAAAWKRGDHAAMYGLLAPADRRRLSLAAFRSLHRRAARIATATAVQPGRPRREGDTWQLSVRVSTRAFGPVSGPVRLRLSPAEPYRVRWSQALTFPGLAGGGELVRRSVAPPRAPLLARGGRRLAGPSGKQTELGASLGLVGEVGPAEGRRRRRLVEAGFPADTPVGLSGLQRALDDRLRGRPGGTLRAGGRVLARRQPVGAAPVRTSIDPDLQVAASEALGDRLGGVAAVEPATGEVLAVSGIALDGAQPPGSTFKIVTLTAALEAGLVTLDSRFPVQTGAQVGGRFLANAHGEACGGDLTRSFSHSCNSVFAPLGVRLGAKRLVAAAERFGFNRPTAIPGAVPDTLPSARRMEGPADVGASAIGQGRVLSTPLGIARVAATIATLGRRPEPTLAHGDRPQLSPATSPRVARLVRDMMLEVVNGAGATGTAAAIEGAQVAGKTGTAELGGDQEDNAWFVAFAPALQPRIAVAVLVVGGGAGGQTAAPIAREVLDAALRDEG